MPEIMTRKQASAKGLSKYFTGSPCKNNHIAERYVQSGTCEECIRESRAIIISPRAEILPPSTDLEVQPTSIQESITRDLELKERKLALREAETTAKIRLLEARTLHITQESALRLESREERRARRARQSVVHSKMVDIPLFISVADYDNVINAVWAFAMMRDPRILRVDIVTGRERDAGVREKAYICRCFPEDKLEIMRITEEIRQRNYPSIEDEMRERQKQLTAEVEAESNWPEGDPR
jgi:hypothetical protein